MKSLAVMVIAAAATGCAYKADVLSTSAAYEVSGAQGSRGPAEVVIGESLQAVGKEMAPTFACVGYKYPLAYGQAIRDSILQTVGGAYSPVESSPRQPSAPAPYPVFRFDLAEFDPTITFTPGLITTGTATVEIALRVTVFHSGAALRSFTARGTGQAVGDGNCTIGAGLLASAGQKSLRLALESFVKQGIN